MSDDLFSRGADWLSDQLDAAEATREITITDSLDSPTVTITADATPGKPDWNSSEYEELGQQVAYHWIVRASELITDDGLELPRRGWIVTDSLDGSQYECTSQRDEEPWQWCDSGHRRVRIQTQAFITPYS